MITSLELTMHMAMGMLQISCVATPSSKGHLHNDNELAASYMGTLSMKQGNP